MRKLLLFLISTTAFSLGGDYGINSVGAIGSAGGMLSTITDSSPGGGATPLNFLHIDRNGVGLTPAGTGAEEFPWTTQREDIGGDFAVGTDDVNLRMVSTGPKLFIAHYATNGSPTSDNKNYSYLERSTDSGSSYSLIGRTIVKQGNANTDQQNQRSMQTSAILSANSGDYIRLRSRVRNGDGINGDVNDTYFKAVGLSSIGNDVDKGFLLTADVNSSSLNPNSTYDLIFDSEQFDTAGVWSTSSSTVTSNESGKWLLVANSDQSSATSDNIAISIKEDAAKFVEYFGGYEMGSEVSFIFDSDGTEDWKVTHENNSSTSETFERGNFSGYYMGDFTGEADSNYVYAVPSAAGSYLANTYYYAWPNSETDSSDGALVSGEYTVQTGEAGLYLVNAQATLIPDTINADYKCYIRLEIDGTFITAKTKTCETETATTDRSSLRHLDVQRLEVGDVIRVGIQMSGSFSLDTSNSFLQILKIGE